MVTIDDIKNIRGGDIITTRIGTTIKALGIPYVASPYWLSLRGDGGNTVTKFKSDDIVYLLKAEHLTGAYEGNIVGGFFISVNGTIRINSIKKGLGIFIKKNTVNHKMV